MQNPFIAHIHSDLLEARRTRRGATTLNSKDVPMGLHKQYDRMEHIALPQPAHIQAPLADVLNGRISYTGGTSETFSLETWGTLLGLSLKKRNGSTKRQYPSGGALYPIETYLLSTAVPGHKSTVFHYNPSLHALEKLWPIEQDNLLSEVFIPLNTRISVSTLIVFTSVWQRSSAKYGDFSYILALLEAGHMSENVLLVATALGLLSRPVAGFDDQRIIKLLDITSEEEQPVLCIALSA